VPDDTQAPSPIADPAWPAPEVRSVYPHIVPTDGDLIGPARHSFSFEGQKHTIEVDVDRRVYWGARSASRRMALREGESDAEWTAAYVRAFVFDPEQKPVIDAVAAQLRAIRREDGLDSDRYLELIVKYVQTIPYDSVGLAGGDLQQRFPVETLVDGTGVCGDKSLLLAALLAHEGYAVSYLRFERESHAAVGVRGAGHTYGASGLLFVESTAPVYVSEIPRVFVGGITLQSEPVAVSIGTSTTGYGAASDVERILKARESAKASGDELVVTMESRPWSSAEWKAMEAQLADINTALTALQWTSSTDETTGDHAFMDRAQAIAWLDQHGWWE
jgi:hypothetical protein